MTTTPERFDELYDELYDAEKANAKLTARIAVLEAALNDIATIYERPSPSEGARLTSVVNRAAAALDGQ